MLKIIVFIVKFKKLHIKQMIKTEEFKEKEILNKNVEINK